MKEGLKGDNDYIVTPEAPNSLRIQIIGCVNQFGQPSELDFTLGTWETMTLMEALAHGVRALALLNSTIAAEAQAHDNP